MSSKTCAEYNQYDEILIEFGRFKVKLQKIVFRKEHLIVSIEERREKERREEERKGEERSFYFSLSLVPSHSCFLTLPSSLLRSLLPSNPFARPPFSLPFLPQILYQFFSHLFFFFYYLHPLYFLFYFFLTV